MRRAGILLLGALCALFTSCHRLNPRYCDDQIRCPAGMVCGPLAECIPAGAGDGGADLLGRADQRVEEALDQRAPDLEPSCQTCTCRPENLAGCICNMRNSCEISCGDDCPVEMKCNQANPCAIRCGDRCRANCNQSSCTVTAGANAEVTCNQTNPCTVTVGLGSLVRCTQSVCNVTCIGATEQKCPNNISVCGRACP